MVVVNLFGLKETNGMFYYALDYIDRLDHVEKILVNRVLYNKINDEDKNKFICCSFFQLLVQLFLSLIRNKFVFTPTSHPIPFYSRQLVVVHDVYPFYYGRIAKIKRTLFNLAIFMSKTHLAYINKSEVLPYLSNNWFARGSLVYLPNLMPDVGSINFSKRMKIPGELVIGLIGSDSTKKNYHALLEKIEDSEGISKKLKFIIYGHETAYATSVIRSFSNFNIQVMTSDSCDLGSFFSNIDLVVSVAKGEGFGRPLASAIALGIPCFITNNSINNEFFSSVKPKDDINDVVASIENALHDKITVNPIVAREKFVTSNKMLFESSLLKLKELVSK
ncbi:glycosyltransferase [Vibrio vulnificus]|nr:glycosyltransferase [Vibrio vulnificus]